MADDDEMESEEEDRGSIRFRPGNLEDVQTIPARGEEEFHEDATIADDDET